MDSNNSVLPDIEIVIAATAQVLEIPTEGLSVDTRFDSINADSIAIIVIADVIETLDPSVCVSDDDMLFAATLGEMAAAMKRVDDAS